MKFDPYQTAFGRHETFALRYGWLTKGFRAALQYPKKKIFESDNSTVELGVGKNMVASIRYWLKACQIIDRDSYKPTKIGNLVFSDKGLDPYLEDEATIWLIHWLLATSPTIATTWYWFFNCFYQPNFTTQELQQALETFIDNKITRKPAKSTLKSDIALVVRMYTQSNKMKITEELLNSPLSTLNLITQSSEAKTYQSMPEERHNLPLQVFGFALAQVLLERNEKSIALENLMYSHDGYPALGSVFRLTEENFLDKLEKLSDTTDMFELRETAGIRQIYIKTDRVDPYQHLKSYYH